MSCVGCVCVARFIVRARRDSCAVLCVLCCVVDIGNKRHEQTALQEKREVTICTCMLLQVFQRKYARRNC